MLAIVAGALALSGPGKANIGDAWPALAVLGACAAWAVDNLTRKGGTGRRHLDRVDQGPGRPVA